jgi:hypothetical protein
MSWIERMLYLGLIVGCYSIGRWHSENRELIYQTVRAREFAIAINENRIDDIQYRLQDDLSIAAYNSYTRFSFGPDLWQKPLPQEPIQVTFNKVLRHAPTNQLHKTPPTPAPAPPKSADPSTPLIQEGSTTQATSPETPKEESPKPEIVPAAETTAPETPKEPTP